MSPRDIGSMLAAAFADIISVTAGGGADGAESDGDWIDVQDYESAKLLVPYEATLADGETLSLAANFQTADDDTGTNAEDYGDAMSNQVVATGPSGGGTVSGVAELDVNLDGARLFLRSQITPTMSASSTDTATVGAALVRGGANTQPQTNRLN